MPSIWLWLAHAAIRCDPFVWIRLWCSAYQRWNMHMFAYRRNYEVTLRFYRRANISLRHGMMHFNRPIYGSVIERLVPFAIFRFGPFWMLRSNRIAKMNVQLAPSTLFKRLVFLFSVVRNANKSNDRLECALCFMLIISFRRSICYK